MTPGTDDDIWAPGLDNVNRGVIEEFRANGGVVGGPFLGLPILLLHHRGAKSGKERVNPLAYQPVDGSYAIFASMGGAPTNPAWFHNLVANPSTTIEVGTQTVPVVARVTEGAERERIWSAQKAKVPTFAEYETRTNRQIPVVLLEPPAGAGEEIERG